MVGTCLAAAVSTVLLAGCAGAVEASPSPSPTSSSAPSVGQSPSPEGTDGAAAQGIASTCDDLIDDPSLSDVTGSATPVEPDGLWATAAQAAGGLLCGFRADELSGTVAALPVDRAGSLTSATEAGCAPSYDSVECIGTGSIDGVVVAVSFLATEQTQTQTDLVTRLRDAALDAVRAAGRAPLPEPAAVPPSCDDLAETIDPSAVLGAEEVFPEPIMEGDFPFDRRTAEAAGLVRACDWSELTDFRQLEVVVVPGAADRWDEESARLGGTAAPIDGSDAVEVQEDSRVRLLTRGADALILVEGRSFRERPVSLDDLRTVAHKLLALS